MKTWLAKHKERLMMIAIVTGLIFGAYCLGVTIVQSMPNASTFAQIGFSSLAILMFFLGMRWLFIGMAKFTGGLTEKAISFGMFWMIGLLAFNMLFQVEMSLPFTVLFGSKVFQHYWIQSSFIVFMGSCLAIVIMTVITHGIDSMRGVFRDMERSLNIPGPYDEIFNPMNLPQNVINQLSDYAEITQWLSNQGAKSLMVYDRPAEHEFAEVWQLKDGREFVLEVRGEKGIYAAELKPFCELFNLEEVESKEGD